MNLYPAIDIFQGNAVRLRQGRREDATVYGTPLEMARRWTGLGAQWLHIVDLDGAFEGRPRNTTAVEAIRKECAGVRIQAGGGIREMAAIERLVAIGADRVILGTAAVDDPKLLASAIDRFGERIAVGIDARGGMVQLQGWTASRGLRPAQLALKLETVGVRVIIYTDIARDGLLEGVNLDATKRMLEGTSSVRVIASGGVAAISDIVRLLDLAHPRLDGVIIGKALYEGRIDLGEVLAVTHAR